MALGLFMGVNAANAKLEPTLTCRGLFAFGNEVKPRSRLIRR